jgi:dienelactone hydrolase
LLPGDTTVSSCITLDKGPSLANAAIFTEYLEVINDATTWAQSQAGVDPARLAIMGDSLGAGLGVSESSRDPRIKVFAAWSGAQATRVVTTNTHVFSDIYLRTP